MGYFLVALAYPPPEQIPPLPCWLPAAPAAFVLSNAFSASIWIGFGSQCAASGRELASLSALLSEANAALDASKGTMQATLAKQAKKLEAVRKVSPRLGPCCPRINTFHPHVFAVVNAPCSFRCFRPFFAVLEIHLASFATDHLGCFTIIITVLGLLHGLLAPSSR